MTADCQNATYSSLMAEAAVLLRQICPRAHSQTSVADVIPRPTSSDRRTVVKVRVFDRVIGVPAPLAQRIAVFSDNAVKQSQLDRHCDSLRKQRCLTAKKRVVQSHCTDFVLLNKAAAVLPVALSTDTGVTIKNALQVRPGTWPARAKSAPSHSEENPQRPSSMAAVKSFGSSADHMGSSLRQSDRFRKLRNQHMPGERLYQSTTFHSTVMMKHDAACSVQSGLQPLQRADSKSISSCTDPGLQVSASGLIPLQHNKTWATEWFATEAGMQPSDTSSSAQISADISARWGQQQSHCTHGSQHALSHDSRAFGLQQIRSARPGSGGSPTSRKEFLMESQMLWQRRKAHMAEVSQRRMQIQEKKHQHAMRAAGLLHAQDQHQGLQPLHMRWISLVTAYRLLHACKVCVQEHSAQQEQQQRNHAASKIALWYKGCLKARQAKALLIKRLQHIWRSVIVIRSHQRQLLFMQLQRFASRHANRVVRLGGVLGSSTLSSGDMSSITPLCATRQSTCLASMTRPSSMLRSQAPSAIPQVVDVTLKDVRSKYSAVLEKYWIARRIYRAQLHAKQYQAQALALDGMDYSFGIPQPNRPVFKLLQTAGMLRTMLVQCHEIVERQAALKRHVIVKDMTDDEDELQDTMLKAYWAAVLACFLANSASMSILASGMAPV